MPRLKGSEVTGALVRPGSLWREIRMVEETGSTNADLLVQAQSGTREGTVLVAERQTAGRGRLGRQWVSHPGATLTFSVLLRPRDVPSSRLGWVPLLAGVATAAAVRRSAGVDAWLKWPNDVLASDAKLAGILAEASGDAVVVGIGLNVSQRRQELPVAGATSLLLESSAHGRDKGKTGPARLDREHLLVAILSDLAAWYSAWRDQEHPGDAAACGLREAYVSRCATLGRQVTVTLPGGRTLEGLATGIDPSGRLEVRAADNWTAVSAGDVTHVRPAAGNTGRGK